MINTEEKNATGQIDRKEFMKQVGLGFGAIVLMNCIQSCTEADIPDPNPTGNTGKLDFKLNINTQTALKTKGGFYLDATNKVIVARTLNDDWIAIDSTCTHQGTTIAYRSASDDFRCPNHGAEFKNTGAVQKGPATSALKKYNVTFSANSGELRIFE